jgi:hypothetical protein
MFLMGVVHETRIPIISANARNWIEIRLNRRQAGGALALLVLLQVWGFGLVGAQQSGSPVKGQEAAIEIKKLITELDDSSFRVREKATCRLMEIGVPALRSLHEAEKKGSVEVQQRAKMLIARLKVVQVDGLNFKLIVDGNWKAASGQPRPSYYNVNLEITNTTEKPVRLYLYNKVFVVFTDSTGRNIFRGHAPAVSRSGSGPKHSPPLAKNEAFVFESVFSLVVKGTDSLGIVWHDPFGGAHPANTSDVIQPGCYFLQLRYANDQQIEVEGQKCWVGSVDSVAERISIDIAAR